MEQEGDYSTKRFNCFLITSFNSCMKNYILIHHALVLSGASSFSELEWPEGEQLMSRWPVREPPSPFGPYAFTEKNKYVLHTYYHKSLLLRNVAIANALQLEVSRRHAKFEVAEDIHCLIIAFFCS